MMRSDKPECALLIADDVSMWDITVHELGLLSECQFLHVVCCLTAKTARCSMLCYSQLPYLVTFAAAKTHTQFYIIEHGMVAHSKAAGKQILLDTISGRVRLLLAAVDLHRILQAVESCLPQEVLPVDQLQVSPDPRGFRCLRVVSTSCTFKK